MRTTVRVRFAPSPTGMFHVGNARSLLLTWVFARQSGGTLVLRIEDTDVARSRPEWVQGILDAMAWLGIGPEKYEGPLFQGILSRDRDTLAALHLLYVFAARAETLADVRQAQHRLHQAQAARHTAGQLRDYWPPAGTPGSGTADASTVRPIVPGPRSTDRRGRRR